MSDEGGVDMQDPRYYQLFTAESAQEDTTAIIEKLSLIKNLQQINDLMLLNYFNEIPLNFAATIDQIERGVVEMTTHKIQLIAMQDQRITFLTSDNLQHNVFAKVQRIDMENKKVFLTDFSYAHVSSSRREHVRVKVINNSEVCFKSDEFSMRGLLHDISIGGLSILAPEQLDTKPGAQGTVSICITGSKLEVPCRLLKIVDGEDTKKYVFKLDSTPKIEMLISQFICQIQNEIIRGLNGIAR
jgi:hypothetical protein